MKYYISIISALLIALMLVVVQPLQAQERVEPDVIPAEDPRTLADAGVRNGMGFQLQLNNYGFGLGGQYRRVVGPMTEILLETHITSLKDQSEQSLNIQGFQIIPNKYNRILTAPLMLGIKHRVFAETLSDNFRVFVQGMAGPSVAFVYPYFDDFADVGYLEHLGQVNDIFQGWGDGFFLWGSSGSMAVGVDFGDNFSRIQTVQFGYSFFYYPQGIQILEPNSPVAGESGAPPQHFFGSPQITFVFGGMW